MAIYREKGLKFRSSRIDKFTIGYKYNLFGESRGQHTADGNYLVIFVDKVYRDTQNFEDFVEGLNVVYLTELLCINYEGYKNSLPLCFRNGKRNNECLHLLGVKKALNSNYTLYIND